MAKAFASAQEAVVAGVYVPVPRQRVCPAERASTAAVTLPELMKALQAAPVVGQLAGHDCPKAEAAAKPSSAPKIARDERII
jgi:hypothetical protein